MTPPSKCPRCDGTGLRYPYRGDAPLDKCIDCRGSGGLLPDEVDLCKGCNAAKHLNADGLCGRCAPETNKDSVISASPATQGKRKHLDQLDDCWCWYEEKPGVMSIAPDHYDNLSEVQETETESITLADVEANKSIGWFVDGDVVKQVITIKPYKERIVGKFDRDINVTNTPDPQQAGELELREQLAAIEHERWAHWQKWMHGEGYSRVIEGDFYLCFAQARIDAWERQINTPFNELSPAEKKSDMEQVDRYWPLIREYIATEIDRAVAEARKSTITGETSDGYHTFNELYEFRKLYNAALFNEWAAQKKYKVHKSWHHADAPHEPIFGGGWFVVVAELPAGQISNHYEAKEWSLFNVPEANVAHAWDGHSPQDVLTRLAALKDPN